MKGRPWTAAEQTFCEVAAACRCTFAEMRRATGRAHGLIRNHLMPDARQKHAECVRAWRERNPDYDSERHKRVWASMSPQEKKEKWDRYYAKHREAHLARSRRWNRENRARRNEIARAYKKTQKRKDYERQWKAKNKHKIAEYHRQWRQQNPETYKLRNMRNSNRRRSGRVSALAPVNGQTLLRRYALFGNRCAYCGRHGKMTADHVLPLAMGGLDEAQNIVPACGPCNSSKNALEVASWYFRQTFFNDNRWRKLVKHCPSSVAGQLSISQ